MALPESGYTLLQLHNISSCNKSKADIFHDG